MTDLLIQCLFITTFIVMIIDTSTLIQFIKRQLYYIRYTRDSIYEYTPTPLIECSKCVSYWATLTFLIFNAVPIIQAILIASIFPLIAITLRKIILY